ncbi:MAG: GDYXXLXY domain-containing protein [Proteobacteria bacterium]|nr:GDYXXLXY domain-containing protein [Pseudomonadota bacterium]
MRKLLFVISVALVFAALNYAIYEKEQVKARGETVFLELAPVDPRSLMQGDYMRLRYAIEQGHAEEAPAERGYMVVALDAAKVGTFNRFYTGGALAPNEKLLHYIRNYSQLQIVPDSFLFQEGHAKFYEQAKYGVFRFADNGSHVLVGLADAAMKEIRPE